MLTSAPPDLAMRCYQPQLAHAIRTQWGGEGLEVAHLVGLEAVGLAMGPAWSPLPVQAVVLDELNAEYLLQQHAYEVAKAHPGHWVGAAYSWAQTRKLQSYERMACRAAQGSGRPPAAE